MSMALCKTAYLQCICTGDAAVLHQAIDILPTYKQNRLKNTVGNLKMKLILLNEERDCPIDVELIKHGKLWLAVFHSINLIGC